MIPSNKKVYTALACRKNKGISFHDFATGFRLAARIKDLRDASYNIITQREYRDNGSYFARYTLIPN